MNALNHSNLKEMVKKGSTIDFFLTTVSTILC